MKPWVKITISFLVGLLLGGAITGFYIHYCYSRVNNGDHKHMVDRLKDQLGLDPTQYDQVGKILDEQKSQMETIRRETNSKLKTIRNATAERINKVLRPDQIKKFQDLRAKWDARMAKDDKGWHIPGHPPGTPPNGPSPDSPAPQSKTAK